MKPHQKTETSDQTKAVLLLETSDNVQTEMVMDLLKENDIPSYKECRGMGCTLDAYMGYSMYGDQIFVSESDFAKANELTDEIFNHEKKIN